MAHTRRNFGFSLVEVLLAVATLSVGMIFIAGTFLVGVHFATVSTERTIAAAAASEAFAKVQIFGVHPSDANCTTSGQRPFEAIEHGHLPAGGDIRGISPGEFAYPSTISLTPKQYFWSALCRRDIADPNHCVQVTVFVSRKVGAGTMYEGSAGAIDRPVPMPVVVSGSIGGGLLLPPLAAPDETRRIHTGCTIVEGGTGEIYRVVGKRAGGEIELHPNKLWKWDGNRVVWVVPPPIRGGKGPCIAVYQKLIRF
ncbi:MAG: prepilin-type N-terminal cleavage/methylation domain-containing protein [Sedimentisphaerales bacterium]|nr:prepilin-type N-terminal cleavage/methylation domain-containing protein [Sedimentisphaerales bacterium]